MTTMGRTQTLVDHVRGAEGSGLVEHESRIPFMRPATTAHHDANRAIVLATAEDEEAPDDEDDEDEDEEEDAGEEDDEDDEDEDEDDEDEDEDEKEIEVTGPAV